MLFLVVFRRFQTLLVLSSVFVLFYVKSVLNRVKIGKNKKMIVLLKTFKKVIDLLFSYGIMLLYLIDTIVKHKTF